MKKYILVIYMMAAGCTMLTAQTKNTQTLMPLTERVNVQADSARINQIIDGCWVAVGTNKPHAIQRDFTNLFDGKPSYRFELKTEDNTLEGYAKGETKGRAEFSYCYATSDDFRGITCRRLSESTDHKDSLSSREGSLSARKFPRL